MAARLQPVSLRLRRDPGPLLPQIERALAAHGEPLRWAITGVEPAPQAQETPEAVVLLIEAVVLA